MDIHANRNMMQTDDPIPFAAFARFERLTAQKPLLYYEPPAWAAASHAIVVDDTVHYIAILND